MRLSLPIITRSDFLRNSTTIMMGTVAAQAIPLLCSPILTRTFSPSDFGHFALFVALISLLSMMATGRYELSIMLPKRDLIAEHLWLGAIALGCFFACASILLSLIVQRIWDPFLSEFVDFPYLVASCVAASAVYQASSYLLNRECRYRSLSLVRILQAATFVAAALVTAKLGIGKYGLVYAFVTSQITSAGAALTLAYPRRPAKARRSWSLVIAIASLKRYIRFPKFLVIAHLLNMSSYRMPALLLPVLFSPISAGFYSLTQQALSLPASVISGAIGDVFRQKASEAYRMKGNCRDLYLKTLCALSVAACGPVIILVLYAPEIFVAVFGDEWRLAGDYARLLAPLYLLQFTSSPLSSMFMIADKQNLDLIWQSVLVTLTCASLLIGWLLDSVVISLSIFSAAYTVMYAINIVATYHFACGPIEQKHQ